MMFLKLLRGSSLLIKSIFGFSPQTRYDSRFEVLSALANALGFRLHVGNMLWPNDTEFLAQWNKFEGRTSDKVHERKFNLYYLAKSVKSLPGDTAECGSLHGAGSFLIMEATKNKERFHHIFDSFEGLSEPSIEDHVEKNHTFKWKSGDLRVSERIVSKNLSASGNFKTYSGWIPDRFNEVQDKKFSFVHIDVDLFEPTWDSLEFFYNRVVVGGLIVCDDYGSEACPGAYKAMNDFFHNKPEEIIHLTGGQGLIIKKAESF